jgi:hypothetical protein
MINILGRSLLSKKINGMEMIKINVQEADQGIYFLKLVDLNNNSRVYKIIKQ